MTEQRMSLTDAFSENYAVMRAQFFDDRTVFPRLGAYLLTRADVGRTELGRAKELLSLSAQSFDGPEEGLDALLSAHAAMSAEPERRLYRLMRAYRELKEQFGQSRHLLSAACVLEGRCRELVDFDNAARSTKKMFLALNAETRELGGFGDISTCVLYVLSELSENEAAARLGRCGASLRGGLRGGAAVRSLAQVCALYPEPETACQNALALGAALRARGLRLNGAYAAALGALALDGDAQTQAAAVERTESLLRQRDGLGPWSVAAGERLFYAVLLASLEESRRRASGVLLAAAEASLARLAAENTADPVNPPL